MNCCVDKSIVDHGRLRDIRASMRCRKRRHVKKSPLAIIERIKTNMSAVDTGAHVRASRLRNEIMQNTATRLTESDGERSVTSYQRFGSLLDELKTAERLERDSRLRIITLQRDLNSARSAPPLMKKSVAHLLSQAQLKIDCYNHARTNEVLRADLEACQREMRRLVEAPRSIVIASDVTELKQRNEQLEQFLDEHQKLYDALAAERDHLQVDVVNAVKVRNDTELALTRLENKFEQLQERDIDRSQSLETEKASLISEIARLRRKLDDQDELVELRRRNEQLEMSEAALVAQRDQLQADIASAMTARDDARSKLASITTEYTQAMNARQLDSERARSLEKERTSLTTEMAQAQQRYDDLTQAAQDARQKLNDVQNTRDQLKQQLANAVAALKQRDQQLEQMHAEAATERSRLETNASDAMRVLKDTENELGKLKIEYNQMMNDIKNSRDQDNDRVQLLQKEKASLIVEITQVQKRHDDQEHRVAEAVQAAEYATRRLSDAQKALDDTAIVMQQNVTKAVNDALSKLEAEYNQATDDLKRQQKSDESEKASLVAEMKRLRENFDNQERRAAETIQAARNTEEKLLDAQRALEHGVRERDQLKQQLEITASIVNENASLRDALDERMTHIADIEKKLADAGENEQRVNEVVTNAMTEIDDLISIDRRIMDDIRSRMGVVADRSAELDDAKKTIADQLIVISMLNEKLLATQDADTRKLDEMNSMLSAYRREIDETTQREKQLQEEVIIKDEQMLVNAKMAGRERENMIMERNEAVEEIYRVEQLRNDAANRLSRLEEDIAEVLKREAANNGRLIETITQRAQLQALNADVQTEADLQTKDGPPSIQFLVEAFKSEVDATKDELAVHDDMIADLRRELKHVDNARYQNADIRCRAALLEYQKDIALRKLASANRKLEKRDRLDPSLKAEHKRENAQATLGEIDRALSELADAQTNDQMLEDRRAQIIEQIEAMRRTSDLILRTKIAAMEAERAAESNAARSILETRKASVPSTPMPETATDKRGRNTAYHELRERMKASSEAYQQHQQQQLMARTRVPVPDTLDSVSQSNIALDSASDAQIGAQITSTFRSVDRKPVVGVIRPSAKPLASEPEGTNVKRKRVTSVEQPHRATTRSLTKHARLGADTRSNRLAGRY